MKTPRRRAVPPDRLRVEGDVLLSIEQVARVLDVAVTRVYRLVREKTLVVESPLQFPRKPYVRESAVHAYRKRRDAWLRLHGRALPQLLDV